MLNWQHYRDWKEAAMMMLSREEEEQLVARSQRGDVSAFNHLVQHYQQIVYRTVYRILGNPDVAADITQDTFFAAFRNIQSFRGGTPLRPWLLRIGSNLACDHWRRVQRHPSESLDSLEDEDEPHQAGLLGSLATTASTSDPEECLLSRELQDLLQRGLQQLSLDQRTAVILCDIEGLSYDEVATATRTTLGTVRSRIARGRARLRNYLYQHRELLPRDYRLTGSSE
ncbi:MAG: sigma-70 family RNA polymerase sigma factor [Ktedonobacteraceae bacterium]|nr:sigma-70 family RNA polymerase sigma factor [Ktedonobacteraceae bacterium]